MKGAVLSADGVYRYLLERRWNRLLPQALLIMLNPSTADANKDDPTIMAVIRLLRALGYGGFEVVNLMAYRTKSPAELPKMPSQALGAKNPHIIALAVARHETIICAWGAHPYAAHWLGGLKSILALEGKTAMCFGKTKAGHPKHPLYLKTGTQLEPFL